MSMTQATNTIKLFGITNCSTVKKAMTWLSSQGIEPGFHDFKKLGIDNNSLKRWLRQHDWQVVLNRRGTTWRQLTAEQQAAVTDAHSACQLMSEKPTLIKRPVIEWPSGVITVGFDPEALARLIRS